MPVCPEPSRRSMPWRSTHESSILRMTVADRFKHFQRTASRHHEVLRDDLEPIHCRTLLDDVAVMLPAQADSEPEERKIRTNSDGARTDGLPGDALPTKDDRRFE